jgi:hypothetical protein
MTLGTLITGLSQALTRPHPPLGSSKMSKQIIVILISIFLLSCSDHVGFALKSELNSQERNCLLINSDFQTSYDKKTQRKTYINTSNGVKYTIMFIISSNDIKIETSWSRKQNNLLFTNKGEDILKNDIKSKIKSTQKCLSNKTFTCQKRVLDDFYYSKFCNESNSPTF